MVHKYLYFSTVCTNVILTGSLSGRDIVMHESTQYIAKYHPARQHIITLSLKALFTGRAKPSC